MHAGVFCYQAAMSATGDLAEAQLVGCAANECKRAESQCSWAEARGQGRVERFFIGDTDEDDSSTAQEEAEPNKEPSKEPDGGRPTPSAATPFGEACGKGARCEERACERDFAERMRRWDLAGLVYDGPTRPANPTLVKIRWRGTRSSTGSLAG